MAKDNNIDVDEEVIDIPDLDEEYEEVPNESDATDETEMEQISEDGVTEQTKQGTTKETITKKVTAKSSKEQKNMKIDSGNSKKETTEPNNDLGDETVNIETKPEGKLKKLWRKYLNKKKITIPLTVLLVFALLMALPATRYKIVGLFVKKTVGVTVSDSGTNRPVSEATVAIGGKTGKTDGNGYVAISGVKVGEQKIVVTKKYYQDLSSDVTVAIKGQTNVSLKIHATGRQVPVTILNSISGKAIKGAVVVAGDGSASTDDNGHTVIVLPPENQTQNATIKLNGYNDKDVIIRITDQDIADNHFTITPSGKVYFLSKRSGKIDVVKSNLDGSSRETVLAGTGNEDDYNTSLLASRDWKYLALHAKREDKAKLFLIDTATDKLSVIDEGNAVFVPVGWYNERFIYTVYRDDIHTWQPKKSAIKSFDAGTKQLKTVDETQAEGTSDMDYASDAFGQVYILENQLVYYKTWSSDYYSGGKIIGKKNSINSVRPDGSEKKVVKEFDAQPNGNSYINSILYEPQEVYFQVTAFTQNTFYTYQDSKLQEDPSGSADKFNKAYPTFLISPSGTKTFWSDTRDGKNTLFIGDRNAENEKEVATLSDFSPYGWYTDEYVLESKNGSELYVASVTSPEKTLKITDYHKPANGFAGYGYGYGGL